MCQQWFSVAGLLLDIFGFLVIAFEWHRTFKFGVDQRSQVLHEKYEQSRALEEGSEPLPDEDMVMAKEFSKLHHKEAGYRERLFTVGIVLVVLGFFGQLIGSLPHGVPYFAFKSC